MSTYDDDGLPLHPDDQAEIELAAYSKNERRSHVKGLAAERLRSGPRKPRQGEAAPDLVHVEERSHLSFPPSMTPWRFSAPCERLDITSLPVDLIQPSDLDDQVELTGEASAELTGGDLDHEAEITGEALVDLTGGDLDDQAEITGEASVEPADEGLDALLWIQLGRGRRTRR